MKLRLAIIGSMLLLTISALAQESSRALIPLAIAPTPGAYGSMWTTELWVSNPSGSTQLFDTNEYCVTLCPPRTVAPGETRLVHVQPQPAGNPGLIAYLPAGILAMNLRVKDLSRQSQTWGTEVPVVPQYEWRRDATRLLSIPNSEQFRGLLRIYDMSGQTVRFEVTAFDLSSGVAMNTITVVTLASSSTVAPRYKPTYAQLDLGSIAPSGIAHIGLDIRPDHSTEYWAFVSVTNNATQHVTLVTPF